MLPLFHVLTVSGIDIARQVSLGQDGVSIPIAAIVGLVAGIFVGKPKLCSSCHGPGLIYLNRLVYLPYWLYSCSSLVFDCFYLLLVPHRFGIVQRTSLLYPCL